MEKIKLQRYIINTFSSSRVYTWVERYERISPNRPGGALYGNYPTGQASIAIAQAMAYLRPYLKH